MIQVMLRTQKNIKSFACNVAPEARRILAGWWSAAEPPVMQANDLALRQERGTNLMVKPIVPSCVPLGRAFGGVSYRWLRLTPPPTG